MATDDFFRARLNQMIELRHPLAVLATRMPWGEIEKTLAPVFAHKARAGRVVDDADLFGSTLELAEYVDTQVPTLAAQVFKREQYPTVAPSGQGFPLAKVTEP